MPSPTQDKEPLVLEAIVKVLDFIQARRAVTFDQLHEYMLMEKLRFGAAVNPVSVLAARNDDRIDVDYDQQMIYSRGEELAGTAVGGAATYRRTG